MYDKKHSETNTNQARNEADNCDENANDNDEPTQRTEKPAKSIRMSLRLTIHNDSPSSSFLQLFCIGLLQRALKHLRTLRVWLLQHDLFGLKLLSLFDGHIEQERCEPKADGEDITD